MNLIVVYLKRLELWLDFFGLTDAFTKAHIEQKDVEKDFLQIALEASKKRVLQGSMDVLLVNYTHTQNTDI